MFTSKCWMGLCSLGVAGMLHAGVGQTASPPPAVAKISASARTSSLAAPADSKTVAAQAASGTALIAEIRRDLHDGHASLRLSDFRFERTSDRSLEGRSKGLVLFDQAASIPIVATVTYDIPLGRVERADYAIDDSSQPPVGKPVAKELRDRIADQIGARLVMEFSQQPVDFSLVAIRRLAEGTDRMVIGGNGISRFPGEGAAYTRFTAVADKLTGRVLTLKYELLQEMQPASEDLLAQAGN